LGYPADSKGSEELFGLVGYYRKFILGFADIAHSLYSTTVARDLVWTPECKKSFLHLKEAIMRAPVLAIPTCNGEYIVRTDASQSAIGAVLMQKQPRVGRGTVATEERTVGVYSRQLSPAQQNYGAYDWELLAVEEAILHWRYYLQQACFLVYTDH
jgi:hypothetical protein